MKDYSLNYNDSKKYILSYKIENDRIIEKLSNKESYDMPYSAENEATIISMMEHQARCAQLKPLGTSDKIYAILDPILLPFAIMNFVNNGGLFRALVLGVIATGTIIHPVIAITYMVKKRYIKKLNYFLDNKEELNEGIKKNPNLELGISKKAANEIELRISKNKQPFDINNIDTYSLSDLRTLKDNIERFSSLGFDEEEPVLEDTIGNKTPVLRRTLEKKKNNFLK